MPELPEVESVRRSLAPHLLGRTLRRADLRRPDVCSLPPPHLAPTPDHLLQGGRITALLRRGKQLALCAHDGRVLVVQLGMTGALRWLPRGSDMPSASTALGATDAAPVAPSGAAPSGGAPSAAAPSENAALSAGDFSTAHVHALWELDDGSLLAFRDPRRFGGLTFLPDHAALAQRWDAALGPDALDAPDDTLRAALAAGLGATRRAVKAALLDQALVAGLGNIYADEALFLARVHPLRPGRALRPPEVDALARAARDVIRRAVSAGGSTLRDYTDADGRAGAAQLTHAVYGRAGEPCVLCGHALASALVTQRTTVWCPRCQPRSRSRSQPTGPPRRAAEAAASPPARGQ